MVGEGLKDKRDGVTSPLGHLILDRSNRAWSLGPSLGSGRK